jgi:hypothetical protein
MPVKIGTLLLNLAKKAGYDTTLLSFPAEQFEVPDEYVTALDGKLFTEDAAKNNPALKNYFFKQALDGVDNGVVRLMEEFEFDETLKGEMNGIKSTYERVPALVKKIRDLEASKSGASKGDKAVLQDQINKLNEEKAKLVKEKESEIKEIKQQYEKDFTNNLVKNKIASANLVTEQFGKEVMEEFAYKFLIQELAAQDAKAVQKNGMLQLVRASDEAIDFYADNKPVVFSEFLDSVLAKHKLIAVTKPPVTPTGPTHTPPFSQQQRPANSSFAQLIEQSKADLAASGV